MCQRSKARYVCVSTAVVVTLGLLLTGKAWSADPVEELRQALVVRPDDRSKLSKEFLAYRDKILEERVKALRSISDLRRGLVEWKIDPDRFGQLQKLDERWRGVIGKRLTATLTEAAKSPEENVRLAIANLIADMGPGVPALDPTDASGFARSLTGIVIGLSRDPRPVVREEALRALGAINADPDQAVPVLGEVLKNNRNSVAVRRAAADGLRRIVRVTTSLYRKLQTKSAEVWATPEELIKTCKDVVQRIAEVSKDHAGLRDRDTEVRITCLEAVEEAGSAFSDLPGAYKKEDFPPSDRKPTPDELVDIAQKYERVQKEISNLQPLLLAMAGQSVLLREAAADPNARVKLAAATTLEGLSHIRLRLRQRVESLPKLDKAARPVVTAEFDKMVLGSRPAMAALLEDPASELDLRRRAVEFLENIGDDAVPAMAALTKALTDGNRFIRWAAVRTLGNLPVEKAAQAVPQMAALLDDTDIDVRHAVARALERLGPRARAALEPVEAKILDKKGDPEFRVAVMYVVASIGIEDTVSAIPLLIRALKDDDARVRRTAAQILGKYGRLAEAAVPALRDMLSDDDTEARQRASDALLNILVAPKE